MSVGMLNSSTPVLPYNNTGNDYEQNDRNTGIQPLDRQGVGNQTGNSGAVNFQQSDNTQAINFGNSSGQPTTNNVQDNSQSTSNDELMALIRDLIERIKAAISQSLQQQDQTSTSPTSGNSATPASGDSVSPTSATSATPTSGDSVSPTSATSTSPATTTTDPQTRETTPSTSTPTPISTQTTPSDTTAGATTDSTGSSVNANNTSSSVGDGPSAGSGPRTFNVTNSQDHDITIGQFNKDNQLTDQMTLKPGQTGQMHYENDFTGLLKQADSDGNYKDDASRLEFYNGFVNTSDIDGRNASIYATDNNGFEIGDKQSIADSAPDNIVSSDSAGNKTIAGYYDGSTDKMNQGGQFMSDKLGTGMTYMHPNDDQLPEGENPMRHTDAMTLDVTFGKA